ncbi:MAG: 3-hydroxyacyl-CoA dehydrogenase family protein [Arenibacterium sp.]
MVEGGSSDAVALAVSFSDAGLETDLIEPDAATRERIAHFLKRDGVGASLSLRSEERDISYATRIVSEAGAAGARVFHTSFHKMPEGGVAIVPTPPASRRLIEICPGAEASEASLEAARGLVAATGRQVYVSTPGAGSTVFHLWRALVQTAERLLLEGADPFETDEALGARGWDLGVFEAQDLIGSDRLLADRRAVGAPVCPVHDRMVEEGRLGRAASVGWYRYPGGGGAVIDPLVEDLIREEAHFAGVVPVARSAEEVAEMLETMLRAEAEVVLGGGDVALILREGFGLPVSGQTEPAVLKDQL